MPGADPNCLALILCDAVYKDSGSGKSTILGTFSTVFAPAFPAMHRSLWVYIQLTNGHEEQELELRIQPVSPDELDPPPIFRGAIACGFPHRLAVVELCVQIENLVLPKEGEYALRLERRGSLIIERRLLAAHIPGSTP